MKRSYHWLNHVLNFIAVILGVYLAFYINESAKANQDRAESRLLLQSLVTDLTKDISAYEQYQIPVNIQHQQGVERLVDLLVKDSLAGVASQLPTIFQLENYAPTASTYSSMKAAGKLRLIEDLALQKELTDYYDGLVLESIEKGEYQVDFFTNELLAWLTNNVDLLTMDLLKPGELILLRNKLIIYQSLIEQKVQAYEMIVENSKQLKTRIESILPPP
jgi:hypothetical protein